jgi:hypothetical protein
MAIYISPNAYSLSLNGISLSRFIEDKGLIPCSSGNLPDIEEKCCLSIICLPKKEIDLFSLGSEIGYLYCHHMAVLVINEINEDEIHEIKKEIDAKKMFLTDIERMFGFLDDLAFSIQLASNLLKDAKDLYARDEVRRHLRDTILKSYEKLKQNNNGKKNHERYVSKDPTP